MPIEDAERRMFAGFADELDAKLTDHHPHAVDGLEFEKPARDAAELRDRIERADAQDTDVLVENVVRRFGAVDVVSRIEIELLDRNARLPLEIRRSQRI